MAGILSLKPKDESKIHPEAVKWFNSQREEIQLKVPLEKLSDDDLNTFLSDAEKVEFTSCMDKITEALATCIYLDKTTSDSMANANIGLVLAMFQLSALWPMHTVGILLKHVYRRKLARVEQERRKRDEEERRNREQAEAEYKRREWQERWQAGYKAVNPPLSDAQRYLNGEERDEFIKSIQKAIEIYIMKGADYLDDMRTYEYRRWLIEISDRKEKEKQKITATIAAQDYNRRLNKEKMKLEALLSPDKMDHEDYFQKEINDLRYAGCDFTEFLSKEGEQSFDRMISAISRNRIDETVSSDFHQFIESKHNWSYILLPSASYSYEKVPCLDFMFDVFAVVETGLWLKPGQMRFDDYVFNLPWREEKGYSVLLQEPEFLGYYYLVLTPEDLGGYVFWQSIPLVLLDGLLSRQTRPNGITISLASDSMTVYKIPGLKDEVIIPDNFAEYLGNIGNIEQMAGMGVIAEKVMEVVKSQSGAVEVKEEASPLEEIREGSKRVKAFQLFSQGKGPSSPEVKALELHKSTRFKYYTKYLADQKP